MRSCFQHLYDFVSWFHEILCQEKWYTIISFCNKLLVVILFKESKSLFRVLVRVWLWFGNLHRKLDWPCIILEFLNWSTKFLEVLDCLKHNLEVLEATNSNLEASSHLKLSLFKIARVWAVWGENLTNFCCFLILEISCTFLCEIPEIFWVFGSQKLIIPNLQIFQQLSLAFLSSWLV